MLVPSVGVAGAFPFLDPFVGIRTEDGEVYFCLTIAPGAFPGSDLHGAFRSRDVNGDAFFALMGLLRFVGHPADLICTSTKSGVRPQ